MSRRPRSFEPFPADPPRRHPMEGDWVAYRGNRGQVDYAYFRPGGFTTRGEWWAVVNLDNGKRLRCPAFELDRARKPREKR